MKKQRVIYLTETKEYKEERLKVTKIYQKRGKYAKLNLSKDKTNESTKNYI